ncbi:MAG: hypothetical protein ACP5LF_03860 [Nitrososphaeria archaeon]|jgi:hypothetical protein|nr:hypothetical protein [Conexivisphaerales archaeon]
MKKPSFFNKISDKDVYNITNAIKADKYWKISENDRRYYYAVILSRGRTPSFKGRFVKVTGFKAVEADDRVAWFCRKYRVGIVDAREKKLICVLTWTAFKKLMHEGDRILKLVLDSKLPPYINEKIAEKLIS